LGKAFGKAGSGILRFFLALATGMGATRLLLSLGSAFVIASFSFLLDTPLLFRAPFFIGCIHPGARGHRSPLGSTFDTVEAQGDEE